MSRGSLHAGPAFGVGVLQQAGRALDHSPRTAELQLNSIKGAGRPAQKDTELCAATVIYLRLVGRFAEYLNFLLMELVGAWSVRMPDRVL